MTVVVDVQGSQSVISGERGIPRYITEFAYAVEAWHPGAVDTWVLDDARPLPPPLEALLPSGRLRRARVRREAPAPDVFHILSPFENCAPQLSIDTVWPTWARGSRTRLVVTLYDLIPMLYPDRYMPDPRVRASYQARIELIRHADRVLAISPATARDAYDLLGIPMSRLTVVGTGVSERFTPAALPAAARLAASQAVPRLRDGYLLCTGGVDYRKNIDGLFAGYARLPAHLRDSHQLVLVCRMSADERDHLDRLATSLGIRHQLLMTGYVGDDILVSLYQAARLFVFPSRYEGFGLPVVEALACGTPAVVGDNSSLVDLVPDPRGRFDADDPDDLARCLTRALTDPEVRTALLVPAQQVDHRWQLVAERTLTAYQHVLGRQGHSRRRIAVVSPTPPARSGVAAYTRRLLPELAAHVDVDVFTQEGAAADALPGVGWFGYRSFDWQVRVRGYDAVVHAIGNSDLHLPVLELLRRHGGAVMAHDVRVASMMHVARERAPHLVEEVSDERLRAGAENRLPLSTADYRSFPPEDYYRVNDLMAAEVVAVADRYFVHSLSAASMALAEADPADAGKVAVLPYGVPDHAGRRPPGRPRCVVSFGIVQEREQASKVVEAFLLLATRAPGVVCAMVGDVIDADVEHALRARVAGAAGRVVLTGRVTDDEYLSWLSRAHLGVQLRDKSNGESSATVADCLGAAVPVVATRLGAGAELPSDLAVLVERDVSAAELADEIGRLLDDDERLAAMSSAAAEYARAHAFSQVAASLLSHLGLPVAGELRPRSAAAS